MHHLKNYKCIRLIFQLLFTLFTILNGATYNIQDFGAKNDGITLNTAVIQKAIDTCSENGGGTINFPPGSYLTGAIILKNDVSLLLEKGAVLLGSTDVGDYLSIKPNYVALRTVQATRQLIFAEDAENIAIRGEGTINGQGQVFVREGNDEGITRPHILQLITCKNVLIEGINFTSSGAWMQHYLACDNLQVRGIRVYNHCNYNNDGLDIDGCRNVTVSDCIIDSDDDALCLKSTSPRPSENITITNCVLSSHCNAIKMGTESTGGFFNIAISNCVVTPSVDTSAIYGVPKGQTALSLEIVDGGTMEYININNISVLETTTPIFIRLGNRARKHAPAAQEPPVGSLRHVNISNVTAYGSSLISSLISGIPGYDISAVTLNNIQLISRGGGTEKHRDREVPENIKGYPSPENFGSSLPACGFYVRHVDNIRFNQVQIFVENKDSRPAFVLEDVKDAQFTYPKVIRPYPNELIQEKNCQNIRVIK
jgi:hypothetical protein